MVEVGGSGVRLSKHSSSSLIHLWTLAEFHWNQTQNKEESVRRFPPITCPSIKGPPGSFFFKEDVLPEIQGTGPRTGSKFLI